MTTNNIKIFGARLKSVIQGFETIKHFGLDEDILIAWLQVKTKLSKKDIQLMLRQQEEFYNKLMSKDILKQFEEDEKKLK
jgi:hypothetical protein